MLYYNIQTNHLLFDHRIADSSVKSIFSLFVGPATAVEILVEIEEGPIFGSVYLLSLRCECKFLMALATVLEDEFWSISSRIFVYL